MTLQQADTQATVPIDDCPPAIDWWITSKCNLSCDFCFGPTPNHAEDTSKREPIVAALVESGAPRVTLTGGEPLVVAALPSFVDRLAGVGKRLVLNTNGELLSPRRAEQLKLGEAIQCVAISVDGGTAETHQLMRGDDARFERTIEAMRLVKRSGATLKMASVISAVNVGEMQQLVDLVGEMQPTIWRVLQYARRGQSAASDRHEFSDSQFQDAVAFARESLPDTIAVAPMSEADSSGCFTVSEEGNVLVPRFGGFDNLGSCLTEPIDAIWRRAPNSAIVKRNKRWHQVLDAQPSVS